MTADADRPLHGTTILLVEQDLFLAGYFRALLERRGARVTVEVSAADALTGLSVEVPDAAAIGMRLADGLGWSLADEIAARDVLIAAIPRVALPARHRDTWKISRPCAADEVASVLADLCRTAPARPLSRHAAR